jgi:hypothetical protein
VALGLSSSHTTKPLLPTSKKTSTARPITTSSATLHHIPSIGKWHLGHAQTDFLLTSHGFDEGLMMGTPYHISGGLVDNHTCIYDTHKLQEMARLSSSAGLVVIVAVTTKTCCAARLSNGTYRVSIQTISVPPCEPNERCHSKSTLRLLGTTVKSSSSPCDSVDQCRFVLDLYVRSLLMHLSVLRACLLIYYAQDIMLGTLFSANVL